VLYILPLALRDAFGGGTIDKDDELLNDVVLGVAEVIFIVVSRSANDRQGVICLCRWEILQPRKFDSQAEIGESEIVIHVNQQASQLARIVLV